MGTIHDHEVTIA